MLIILHYDHFLVSCPIIRFDLSIFNIVVTFILLEKIIYESQKLILNGLIKN